LADRVRAAGVTSEQFCCLQFIQEGRLIKRTNNRQHAGSFCAPAQFVIAFEAIFGLPDERLTIRHDSGANALPYVGGTLMAVQKVMTKHGLVRGLDRLLFSDQV
jgi:hypothetical protein